MKEATKEKIDKDLAQHFVMELHPGNAGGSDIEMQIYKWLSPDKYCDHNADVVSGADMWIIRARMLRFNTDFFLRNPKKKKDRDYKYPIVEYNGGYMISLSDRTDAYWVEFRRVVRYKIKED